MTEAEFAAARRCFGDSRNVLASHDAWVPAQVIAASDLTAMMTFLPIYLQIVAIA